MSVRAFITAFAEIVLFRCRMDDQDQSVTRTPVAFMPQSKHLSVRSKTTNRLFVVDRRSSFIVRRSSFAVRCAPFVVRRSSFSVRRSSFIAIPRRVVVVVVQTFKLQTVKKSSNRRSSFVVCVRSATHSTHSPSHLTPPHPAFRTPLNTVASEKVV